MKKGTKVGLTLIGLAGLAVAAAVAVKKYQEKYYDEDLIDDDDEFMEEYDELEDDFALAVLPLRHLKEFQLEQCFSLPLFLAECHPSWHTFNLPLIIRVKDQFPCCLCVQGCGYTRSYDEIAVGGDAFELIPSLGCLVLGDR